MRINHNIPAMNTHRVSNINVNSLSKSMEKLSSGLRINRAADDAAGMSISEKMRAQIRGLTIASRNCSDGISLVQTAEGGMNEISAILQRVRELSVQSATGTYTNEDRKVIQDEVDQLMKELDSISTNTEFNTISLLNGNNNKEGGVIGNQESIVDIVEDITQTGGVTDKYEFNGKKYASAIIDFSNMTSADQVDKLEGKGVNYTCCTCNKAYSIKFIKGAPDVTRLQDPNPVMEIDITSIGSGIDLANKIKEVAYGEADFTYDPEIPSLPSGATSFVNHFSQIASNNDGFIYIYDNREQYSNDIHQWPDGNSGRFDLNVYGEEEEKDKVLIVDIQAGSNEGQMIKLDIPNVTREQLGLEKLFVNTQDNASMSIDKVDKAINRASRARSVVGAYQNRLEHTTKNLDNSAQNLQEAESRIKDTDMAAEMARLSKTQVLLQASQSMLAQANEMSKSVLKLLQ